METSNLYFMFLFSTRGCSEDSLALSKSLLSLQKWVLELMVKCLHRLIEDKQAVEYVTLVEKSCDITTTLHATTATRALLYVAHLDNKGQLPARPT